VRIVKPSAKFFCKLRFVVGDQKQLAGRAFEQAAERFEIFVAQWARFVVDHAVEILIAHAHLPVEPVFRVSLFLEQRQNVQTDHKTHLYISDSYIR